MNSTQKLNKELLQKFKPGDVTCARKIRETLGFYLESEGYKVPFWKMNGNGIEIINWFAFTEKFLIISLHGFNFEIKKEMEVLFFGNDAIWYTNTSNFLLAAK